MQTSMRVDQANRDALARIAAEEFGGVSLDEALRMLLFEHETIKAPARKLTLRLWPTGSGRLTSGRNWIRGVAE